ncbi:MAG TPA: alpha/beta fold hydrolase [Xanthobacteraceae bacterium]|jgi:carboxylesterase|nr:alpha/beta fold hydrolase [Xanthobacteraceae bacterium]
MNTQPVDHSLFFEGGKTGILLIHGLGGTPVELKIVASGLRKEGFTVSCCKLAGHCGTEEDLIATGWRDWVASVELALDALSEKCDIVLVGGLSMGAILALHVAAKRPGKVSGLLLYAPTLWYDGFSVPWYAFLLKWLINTPIGQRYRFEERQPYGIKDERIRKFIMRAMGQGKSAEAGLASTPSQSLQQLWELVDVVKPQLSGIKTPALIVHAREDDISDLSNTIYLQRKLGGLVDTLVLDDSYHIVTIDRQRSLVADRSAAFARWITRLAEKKPGKIDVLRQRAAVNGIAD